MRAKQHPMQPERAPILGVGVDPITAEQAVETIERWISERRREYVCVTGAHGIVECRRNPRLKAIHSAAGLVVPDGMPVVFLARRLGFHATSRVYGPDLMRAVTELSAARGYRQFYYGGAPGVAQRLADRLRAKQPTLQIAGILSPSFRPLIKAEVTDEIDTINSSAADIVWVGLSTPKQEMWMAERRSRLTAPVLVGVGAAFDFLAGTKRQAPLWMQRSSLEWLFRMLAEPRRLSGRYARIVPTFAALACKQLISTSVRPAYSGPA